jgi:hypothetical protein
MGLRIMDLAKWLGDNLRADGSPADMGEVQMRTVLSAYAEFNALGSSA